MNTIFSRIRIRILAIVLMSIIPAFALIYLSAAERKRQISQEIEDNAIRLSRFLASNLERDLSEGRGFLNSTAQLFAARPVEADSCASLLNGLLGNSSVFKNLGAADLDGSLFCSARPAPDIAGMSRFKWFEAVKVRRDFAVGFDFNGAMSKEASIILAYPVFDRNGGISRVLFAVMDLDWVNRLAEDSRLPSGSAISVTNRRGDAIARYPDPDKWVGKPYPIVPSQENAAAHDTVKIAYGIDGVKRLYAFAPVVGAGDLIVHVGIRREAIWEPANQALRKQLFALGAVTILAILAAWFASDIFLLKQIRTMIRATKELGAGKSGARSSLSYDTGELGELARAFDEMAETLEWREAQLRESEIERANPADLFFEMIDFVPAPCMVLNEALEIQSGNPSAQSVLSKLSPDAFIGASISRFLPDLSPEWARTVWGEDPQLERGLPNIVHDPATFTLNAAPFKFEIRLSRFPHSGKSFIVVLLRVLDEDRATG
jgi:hypothetical protein